MNLGGTARTLDGISGSCPIDPGVLNRTGWTFLDDSSKLLFEAGDPPWATPRRSTEALDWYIFVYGNDYPAGLAEYLHIAGHIPLPPRFVFGAWWSRYWDYSDAELRALVEDFRKNEVPLDVLVIDMGWHLDGWTGYTWNPKYFPDPEGFLKWAHEQGLKVTLNLHPAEGVGKQEARFAEMCQAMGLDPAKTDRIPFDAVNKKYADAYFNVLHHPLEKQGIDFWWMDWQQGKSTTMEGLDPLWWLNYLHWTDQQKRSDETGHRPLIFSRWGGLGNHRYPIGFSGDTFSNWPSLAFQPYFTSTAGNVGYAYWSHDIGGHMPGTVEPSLYARWVEWGAMSPILRTHTTKNPNAERRAWAFPPEAAYAAKKAYHFRYELATSTPWPAVLRHRPAALPSVVLSPAEATRPTGGGEYMFGDDILRPVTEPTDPQRCAMVSVFAARRMDKLVQRPP
jgi:alpha-glucosidase